MTGFLRRYGAALGIFALGAGCLVLGIFRGEAATVVRKATLICLECIGIG